MVEVDTVLVKVASRCNIDCSYCYVYHMGDAGWSRGPKVISPETVEATAKALALLAFEQGRPFDIVLHGGEPLLLGPANLRFVISELRRELPTHSISIQTNGILVDDEILDLCARNRVTLSVSLDGPRQVHDRNRVGFAGEGTFEKVMQGIDRIRAHAESSSLFTGVLAVIDPASDPCEVYDFFKSLDLPSVDFIYRDGNHSRLPVGKSSPNTTEYGRWMCTLLDHYLADETPIRIRILDDMIKLVLGGGGSKEGVGVTDYGILIIDTDGSVTKNDTLKSSFHGADRFSEPWTVHTRNLGPLLRSAEFAAYHAMQRPSNPTCLACPDLTVCGGGMTLQRWRDDTGYDNPSVYCEDLKLLIGHIRTAVDAYVAVA
jgi:uncharacterized protein